MDSMISLVVLAVLGIPTALAVWLIVRAVSARNQLEEFSGRLNDLELEVIRLKREKESPKPAEPTPVPEPLAEKMTPAPVVSARKSLSVTLPRPRVS